MRTAIFGGTFDPVHTGHAMVASYISQWGNVDEVWLMVTPRNPLKSRGGTMFSDSERLRFARMVADGAPGVRVSDFEMSLPVPSYTWVTLGKLKEKYPDREFILVVGSDNWLSFSRWRNWREIIAEHELIVYPRPGYELPTDAETLHGPAKGVTVLRDAPVALISSTFIRDALREGKDVNYFIPTVVRDCIAAAGEQHKQNEL